MFKIVLVAKHVPRHANGPGRFIQLGVSIVKLRSRGGLDVKTQFNKSILNEALLADQRVDC